MKRFPIRNIPDNLHKELKIMAVEQGKSLNTMLLELLDLSVCVHKDMKKKSPSIAPAIKSDDGETYNQNDDIEAYL